MFACAFEAGVLAWAIDADTVPRCTWGVGEESVAILFADSRDRVLSELELISSRTHFNRPSNYQLIA